MDAERNHFDLGYVVLHEGESAEVLASGKTNRFGLHEMRERAMKLGARLEFWSKPGAGTEIELRIPAKAAYGTSLRKWWRRSAQAARNRRLPPSDDRRGPASLL
jgi:hypothetical protein